MKIVYYKIKNKLNKIGFLVNYYRDDLIIILVCLVATTIAIFSNIT